MNALVLLLLLLGAKPLPGPVQEADALRSEVNRLQSEVTLLGALSASATFSSAPCARSSSACARPARAPRASQPVAAPFLAAPPAGPTSSGSRRAPYSPAVEVESFLRHDTVVLKLRPGRGGRRAHRGRARAHSGRERVDLPIDQSGPSTSSSGRPPRGTSTTSACATGERPARGERPRQGEAERGPVRAGRLPRGVRPPQTSRIAVTPTTRRTAVTVTIERRSFAPAVATTRPHFTSVFARRPRPAPPRR